MTEVEQTQEETTQEVKPVKKTRGKGAAAKPESNEGGEKVTRGRASSKFSNEAKITLISPTNPKRPGSKAADDWTKYTDGMTVGEALALGISRADILYNASHKFLTSKVTMRRNRASKLVTRRKKLLRQRKRLRLDRKSTHESGSLGFLI